MNSALLDLPCLLSSPRVGPMGWGACHSMTVFSGVESQPWGLVLNLWELLASLPGTWYSYGARRPALKFQPGLSSPCDPRQFSFVGWGSCFLSWNYLPVFLSTWPEFKDSVIIGPQSLRPGRNLQFPLLEVLRVPRSLSVLENFLFSHCRWPEEKRLHFMTSLRPSKKSVSVCCVLSTSEGLFSCRPHRIPGGGADYMSISQMRKLRPREATSPTGSVTCTARVEEELWGPGSLAPWPCCLTALSLSSHREPAAPWEQLYQRVQHSRQLHVQQRAVHPRRLAVRRTARLLRQEWREGVPWVGLPFAGGGGGGPSRGVRGEFPPVCVARRGARASGLAVLPAPPVSLSQSSVVSAEAGVLVWWEPQLWGSREPFHQTLLTPTLGSSHRLPLTWDAEAPRGWAAPVSPHQQAADLDLNPGLPDPWAQAGNHFERLPHCAAFLTIRSIAASPQVSAMELVLTLW